MQSYAHQLAEKLNQTGKLPPDEYNDFMTAAAAFNEKSFRLQRETLFQIAHIDDLTGIGDEIAMFDFIEAERERVKRMDQDASIVICELADYTNQEGEPVDADRAEVLVEFSQIIANQLRPYDQLYRIDNDEFLICLPYTDLAVAELVIKRLHDRVSGKLLVMKDGSEIKLRTHMGIAPIGGDENVETILGHAIEAMNIARVNVASDIFTWEE
jgi:diguanylate cyclase (GGDEF)-like protein